MATQQQRKAEDARNARNKIFEDTFNRWWAYTGNLADHLSTELHKPREYYLNAFLNRADLSPSRKTSPYNAFLSVRMEEWNSSASSPLLIIHSP